MKNGYIVLDDCGSVMMLGNYHDGPSGGLLLSGQHGTVLRTRRRARAAIARSRAYSERMGLKWRTDRYRIVRVLVP